MSNVLPADGLAIVDFHAVKPEAVHVTEQPVLELADEPGVALADKRVVLVEAEQDDVDERSVIGDKDRVGPPRWLDPVELNDRRPRERKGTAHHVNQRQLRRAFLCVLLALTKQKKPNIKTHLILFAPRLVLAEQAVDDGFADEKGQKCEEQDAEPTAHVLVSRWREGGEAQ